MASIINAATSGGLVTSADTSGVLQLQTASTTAVTVTASQNVGIGTTSPSTKLTVYDATSPQVTFDNGTSTFIVGNSFGGNNKILYGTGAHPMIFYTNATEAARINSSGNLQTIGTISVGNATPSTSGAGITFPASQSASSNANTLDDYEEGTWTPTITFGGASVGVTYNTTFTGATYTKIGNRVCVSGYLEVTNKGSSTGDASIGNLPFTSESGATKYLGATVGGSAFTFANQFWARIAAGSTLIDLLETTEAGAQSFITNSDFTNFTGIYFSATYTV